MSDANCLMVIPAETSHIEAGESVNVQPLENFLVVTNHKMTIYTLVT